MALTALNRKKAALPAFIWKHSGVNGVQPESSGVNSVVAEEERL